MRSQPYRSTRPADEREQTHAKRARAGTRAPLTRHLDFRWKSAQSFSTQDRLQAALQKLCENQGVLFYAEPQGAPREVCARDPPVRDARTSVICKNTAASACDMCLYIVSIHIRLIYIYMCRTYKLLIILMQCIIMANL